MRDFAKILRDDEGRQMLVYVDPGAEEGESTILHCISQRDDLVYGVKLSFAKEEDAYRTFDRMDGEAAKAIGFDAGQWSVT